MPLILYRIQCSVRLFCFTTPLTGTSGLHSVSFLPASYGLTDGNELSLRNQTPIGGICSLNDCHESLETYVEAGRLRPVKGDGELAGHDNLFALTSVKSVERIN